MRVSIRFRAGNGFKISSRCCRHKPLPLIRWFSLAVCLQELVYGTRIVVTGDLLEEGETSLITSNHRTELDWMFLFSYFSRARASGGTGGLGTMKIFMKKSLRFVPAFGW